jgi:choline dehydrogenase-like flavoprotein
MLSGVGPAEHLKSLGIEVTHDLPGVGDNLQDHPRAAVTFQSKKALGFDQEPAAREYNASRKGPLSSNGIGVGAFVKTFDEAPLPDIQIFLTASPRDTFSVHAALMRPESRGRIRLRSKSITDAPLIQANYLEDERDLNGLVRGLEMARKIAEADALRDYRGEELSPGTAADDIEGMRNHIRQSATTFFHAIGTCKMGTDPMAVVDGELRVRGLEALRVIDASIMPTLISGATHAATVMIAEKGADFVKSTW